MDIESTTIHEAAHAVIAHYLLYPVVCINVAGVADGRTQIDYGDFQVMAAKWMDNEAGDSRFAGPKDMDEASQNEFASDLIMILVAGYVAEYVHLNMTEDLQLFGSGRLNAEAISNRFGIDLQQELKVMHQILNDLPFWQAIKHLSTRIMNTENMILDANGIKASFEESGFLAYCAELNMSLSWPG